MPLLCMFTPSIVVKCGGGVVLRVVVCGVVLVVSCVVVLVVSCVVVVLFLSCRVLILLCVCV